MAKQIIKPKIFSISSERASIPIAHKGKIGINIKDALEFNKLGKRQYYGNMHTKLNESELNYYRTINDKIHKAGIKNNALRQQKLEKHFVFDANQKLSEYIRSKYINSLSVALPVDSKYLKLASKEALSFRWKYDPKGDVVHMFESDNYYGLDSKNPIYKEFKRLAIDFLLKTRKGKFTKDTEFVVDSEIIDE